jgi:hypothetical protein
MGGIQIWFHSFLNSALDGRDWSDSRPGRSNLKKRITGTFRIGGQVGLRADPDALGKKYKSLTPTGKGNANPLIFQSVV